MKPVLTKQEFDRVTKANEIIRDREHLVQLFGFAPWENKETAMGTLFFARINRNTRLCLRKAEETTPVLGLPANARVQIATLLASEANQFFDHYQEEPHESL